MPLDNRPLHLHKSQKIRNVYCLLSQCTTLKQILMEHWSLIHNHPLLKTVFTKPPIISYKRENPLKKCLRKQKYNLKVIMRRDHKSYIGYPSRSVFTFIPQKECATCTTAWLQLTTTISLPPSVKKKQ